MSKILDLSTTLRARFWSYWKTRRRNLELPEKIAGVSPEKAFRMGHRQGFWEGALDATRVLTTPDQSEEDDSPRM